MCVLLYICMYGCLFQGLHGCRGQRSMLHRSQATLRLETGSLIGLEWVCKNGWPMSPREVPVLPNQCLDRKHTTPAWCSHMASTDWAQTLMFAWRELCQVIHVHIINHQWPNETIVRRKRGEVHWFCKSNYDKVTNERKHQIKCVRGMKKSE